MCPVDCKAPFAVMVMIVRVLPPSRISLSLIVRTIDILNHSFDVISHSQKDLVGRAGVVMEVL
jgi:hypothetical protein